MNVFYYRTKRNNFQQTIRYAILLFLPAFLRASHSPSCQELPMKHKCSCFNSNEGVSVDCQYVSVSDIKNAVTGLSNIYSLTIVELNNNDEEFGEIFDPGGVCVTHIHISQANIRALNGNTLANIGHCLQSLTITASSISDLTQKCLNHLDKLSFLEISACHIKTVPGLIFDGLHLVKLNLKGNLINQISDAAFSSLESSLLELDLSENNLTSFPSSVINLKKLQFLKISWNGLLYLPIEFPADMVSLEHLDLSSNNFEFVSEDCFKFFPNLKVLSLHFNFIYNVHVRAFFSLSKLESLDLSHNRIKFLNPNLFQNNKNLKYVDFNHNHLHNIYELFSNLPALIELHISDNNILEVPKESFMNSTNIRKLYLGKNALHSLHSECFYNLDKLEILNLESNYFRKVPQNIFIRNIFLYNLRLDHNELEELDNKTLMSLVNIKIIKLNNNKLKHIFKEHFARSLYVEEIYLHHNNIRLVEVGTFLEHKHLKILSLGNNNMTDFGHILSESQSHIVELHIDNNNISRLKFIGMQAHLSHLSINFNKLIGLDKEVFVNLPSLKRLSLNHNDLTIIDDYLFQYLNATRFLDLNRNAITTITNNTLVGLIELEDLNLSYNNIMFVMGFAFDPLKKLRNLNLSNNPLKKLFKNVFQQGLPLSSLLLDGCDVQFIEEGTFRGLDNLKLLSLKNNSLKTIDITSVDVPGLKYLFLSQNMIDSLAPTSFSNFLLVEVLIIEHCNIDQLQAGMFHSNKHLIRVNLAQNNLNTMPNNIVLNTNVIVEFNMSNNFLDHIPIDALLNFTRLEILDLSDNLVTMVEVSQLKLLPKLRHLNLRNNEIKTIVPAKNIKIKELAYLDLSANRIMHVPKTFFESLVRIRHLNLSSNEIVNFNLAVFSMSSVSNFINIDLSTNPMIFCTFIHRPDNNILTANVYEMHITSTNMTNLDEFSFGAFANLQHLFLQNNKFRRLPISPFLKLNNLEDLDLASNKISSIKSSNFRGLVKLQSLCLSNNHIESLESFPEDLKNLKILDLSRNKIQNILNEDLSNLKELSVLLLSFNNIKYISATSTKNLQKLTYINLQQNKLELLSIELLTSFENYIEEIVIKDNLLKCNCEKENTWVWIQDHPKQIDASSIACLNNEQPIEKCEVPIISELVVDRHKDDSISVNWFVKNRTAVKAIHLVYYESHEDKIQSLYLEPYEATARIEGLESNKRYVLCVMAVYNDHFLEVNDTGKIEIETKLKFPLNESSTNCVSFNTLKKPLSLVVKNSGDFDIKTILNRRMGLLVGCCLGVFVFIVMVSLLLYTKVKERKRIAIGDPGWEDENNDLNSKDDVQNSTAASTDNILEGF